VSSGTLIDTGPLVALVNRKDPSHTRCLRILKRLPPGPLVTTWPCLTEAMHLLHRAGGFRAQAVLWELRAARRLSLHDLSEAQTDRLSELMAQYRDIPMDFADASLLIAAETLGLRRVLTLDSHFYAFRLSDGSALEVVL
jgi:uncharacterized protein